jgi:uncharacterized protein YjaG (DUF416 family)
MKLATTCNKNVQQKDAKNNERLQTEWKMTWRNFKKTIERGRNGTFKA